MNAFFQYALTLAYKLKRSFHKLLMVVFFASGSVAAQEVVVLAFGDSLTAGYGLAEADGFAPQLQAWLQGSGADVRVVNGGVSGDTTAAGLARVDWVLSDDIDAVILELGANDFLRGLNPAAARENLDAILAIFAARDLPVLIAGMPAPGNFGADYKTAFDSIYPDLADKYAAALYPFFMQGIAQVGSRQQAMEFIQSDRLHPTAAGVELMVGDIGPYVLELITGLE